MFKRILYYDLIAKLLFTITVAKEFRLYIFWKKNEEITIKILDNIMQISNP